MKEIMSAKDIKEYLGVSLNLVYDIMKRNDFPTLHINRRKLVKREDFLKWLEMTKENDESKYN